MRNRGLPSTTKMSLEADPPVSVKSPETADLANSSVMSSLETWLHSRIPDPQKLCDIILGSPKNSYEFFHKEEVFVWNDLNKLFGQPNTCTVFYAYKFWNNVMQGENNGLSYNTVVFFFL